MRKWKYTTLGHLGTVTTELEGDTIEMESGTEVYPASEVDALLRQLRDEIVSQSGLKDFYQDWDAALALIDSALMGR